MSKTLFFLKEVQWFFERMYRLVASSFGHLARANPGWPLALNDQVIQSASRATSASTLAH